MKNKIITYKVINKIRLKCKLYLLKLRNIFSTDLIIDPDSSVVVSLTSYGKRVENVYITIESISRGDMRPAELILWIDDDDILERLPKSLKRLKKRGLEIRKSEDIGPHKKYYPYVTSDKLKNKALVTADDDVLYPHDWLSVLNSEGEKSSKKIICYRAHTISFYDDGKIMKYVSWSPCRTNKPSVLNFATGVSGVYYDIEFQRILKDSGKLFLTCCPKADDVWLHRIAVLNGYEIKQIYTESANFPEIPGSQKNALANTNVSESGNDKQIKDTYGADEINILRHEYFIKNKK